MVMIAVALAVVVATTARVFGSGGDCRSPSSIIGTGDLPRASCHRSMRLCTSKFGQWAVCEFGMNVLICVCGLLLLLLLLRFNVFGIGI
jgi:hypothetical protein